MFNIKSLIAATLLSGIALVSFAETPVSPAPSSTPPAVASATDVAAKPAMKPEHKAKKVHKAKKQAASAADTSTK
jgi:cell division septation protein DedD